MLSGGLVQFFIESWFYDSIKEKVRRKEAIRARVLPGCVFKELY